MTSKEMEKAILSEIDAGPEAFSEASVCTIDPNTRVITVPASLSLFGTESDEKTNRLTFRCPRVVGDNVDLSNFQICINFRNANSEKDRYIVEDMMIDGDEITFSWSLSRKVTKYKGRVSFIVCALNTREGTIVNEWNTTLAFGTVLEGLEADEVNLDEEEKDIILQLLAMVDAKSNKALEEIEAAKNGAVKEVQTNANEKLNAYNSNAETKIAEYNQNADNIVAELADIARPVEVLERLQGGGLDAGDGSAVCCGDLAEKARDERGDVFAVILQRGRADVDDVQPVVEVLAELAFADELQEVLVRRDNQAEVGLDIRISADALEDA